MNQRVHPSAPWLLLNGWMVDLSKRFPTHEEFRRNDGPECCFALSGIAAAIWHSDPYGNLGEGAASN